MITIGQNNDMDVLKNLFSKAKITYNIDEDFNSIVIDDKGKYAEIIEFTFDTDNNLIKIGVL